MVWLEGRLLQDPSIFWAGDQGECGAAQLLARPSEGAQDDRYDPSAK